MENERAWKVGIDQIKAANYNLTRNLHAPSRKATTWIVSRCAAMPALQVRSPKSLRGSAQSHILAESLKGTHECRM